eukprot:IDg19477t1
MSSTPSARGAAPSCTEYSARKARSTSTPITRPYSSPYIRGIVRAAAAVGGGRVADGRHIHLRCRGISHSADIRHHRPRVWQSLRRQLCRIDLALDKTPVVLCSLWIACRVRLAGLLLNAVGLVPLLVILRKSTIPPRPEIIQKVV